MPNNEWKEKIRADYKNIISEKQIQATIDYWDDFISTLLTQTRQETVREMIGKIEKEEKEKWDAEIHCTCLPHVIATLREEYGIDSKE